VHHYFGYGSNMNQVSLAAKGVRPLRSVPGSVPGWELCFDVHHWFRHEGGVGNIRPSDDSEAIVRGVLHLIEDVHLERLDAVESYGVGYDRIEVPVHTADGVVSAITYVGLPDYIDRSCRPTQRYLNILVAGAQQAGIDPAYIERIANHPIHEPGPSVRFEAPVGEWPEYLSTALPPAHTALAGHVFDMSRCRPKHECLVALLGGVDTTLFHLRRMDTSTADESIEAVLADRLREDQRAYLHAYLNEYAREYRYAGVCRYPSTTES